VKGLYLAGQDSLGNGIVGTMMSGLLAAASSQGFRGLGQLMGAIKQAHKQSAAVG
jgi:hypothetical protein